MPFESATVCLVSKREHLVRVVALTVLVGAPYAAIAQQVEPANGASSVAQLSQGQPVNLDPDAAAPFAVDAGAGPSTTDDAGRPLPVERIVLHTRTQDHTPLDLRTPGAGRATIQLQSTEIENELVNFHIERAEDDIPRDLRRRDPRRASAERTHVCRGDCMLFLPTSRPIRISATLDGTRVSTEVNPPPEGVRLRFQRPSRGALIASYVLYPTAATLGVSGALSALLVQDPAVRLGSAIGLFSGAAVALGLGIGLNVVAFDGTVRTEAVTPAAQPSQPSQP